MKTKLFIGISLAVIFIGFLIILLMTNKNNDVDHGKQVSKETPEDTETIIAENPETEEAIEQQIEFMDEKQFQQILHEMTHQKVKADVKWGFTPMTEEQIDRMLRILENSDFEHEEFYRDALTAWKNGDFSNAVEVHNTIWKWQNGTIGKAYGLMTEEEEEEYLKKQRWKR